MAKVLYIGRDIYCPSFNALNLGFVVESGRFSIHGNSRHHTKRLQGGENILQRYEKEPASLLVINKMTLLFKIQSLSEK